jgi:hypothetical protein
MYCTCYKKLALTFPVIQVKFQRTSLLGYHSQKPTSTITLEGLFPFKGKITGVSVPIPVEACNIKSNIQHDSSQLEVNGRRVQYEWL